MSSGGLEDKAMRTEYPPDVVTFQPPVPHGRTLELYKEETVIGNGAYGTVYKAKDISQPAKYVALKKVRIPINEDGVPVSILREIALVRQLDRFQHPNIVRFLDVCHGPRLGNEQNLLLFLVFEFVEMDLAKYILRSSPDGLSPTKVKDIMFQVLCGVDFLHSQRIVHRDLKPQNLLISETGQVKLADFGLAKVYDFTMKLTNVVVTLWYRPPEVLLGSSYGTAVDIWSVGCIFAELIRRRPLLPGTHERDQLEKIFDLLGTPIDEEWPRDSPVLPRSFHPRPPKNLEILVPGLDPVGLSLLEKMLIFDQHHRISAHDAARHPYFENRPVPEIEFPPLPPLTTHMSNLATSATPSTSTSAMSSRNLNTTSSSLNVTATSLGHCPDDSGYSSFIRDNDNSRK
ncbi:unnamed protein product [Orchesella dallaii]|uniref:Protein kinase domain-containing protein n=1 Tax=Orchesella dallaii TaxID=48710 RepID=A0ABP1S387_9HEXA